MHILYIHQHFSTPKGKTGTRSYEFAKRLIKEGHSVTVLCGSYAGGVSGVDGAFNAGIRRGLVDGIDVIELYVPYSNKLSFIKRIFVFLSFAFKALGVVLREKYDVIYATSTPLTVAIPAIFAKLFRNKPYIFEVRDLWPELPRAMGVIKNPFVLWCLSILEKSAYRRALKCVALSPGIRAGIERHLTKGAVVAQIPNGCDLDDFKPVSDKSLLEVLPELVSEGFKANDFCAVYSGTHGLANGLDAVLDAGRVLKERGINNIKLVLIGDGGQKARLVERKVNEQLDSVIFIGSMPKDGLAMVLPHFDLGLQILANVPAFYYGTSPNKFFDYIAAGLPVLVNYPGWLADMITEYKCGVVVRPDNAEEFVEKLVEFSALQIAERNKQGVNSRVLAEDKFDRGMLAGEFVGVVTSS